MMKFGILPPAILSAYMLLVTLLDGGVQKLPTNECFRDQTARFSQKAKSEILRLCNGLYLHNNLKLVVIVVASLENLSAEEYAVREFEKFSQKDAAFSDTGIIVLVSFRDREMRIELGRISSERMSNSQAKTMIDQEFIPNFKQGKFESGLIHGVSSIVEWLDSH
ncbi:TPM domain-containing protein [Leptospira santarosai]|uniref:TPM domain-containing protein n=1 Tax=Leptospira santarosai TaxID=28183 RepID=UPI0021004B90|nr:TPM domain-containing protein [Leptospira santarosai]